ncbi:homoserine O-succinyltransferase [Paraglaciecola sp.]|uniref:homoserine O-acetyltransferase/O-succinyltransferase family protein n=1 Tax=Paraglaciecola sp. TaxID=1920173 RepID=UPI0030F430D5
MISQKNKKLNIGIVNLMPNTSVYHQEIEEALLPESSRINLHWIKLLNKSYSGKDSILLHRFYDTYQNVKESCELDALIITGAPVELLEFKSVVYWQELKEIINSAIDEQLHTFGICWGALAIGNVLGLQKELLDKKIFGVLEAKTMSLLRDEGHGKHQSLDIPFSIQACFCQQDVEYQLRQGKLLLLACSESCPFPLLQTADQKHLMCLGHPEYGPSRLVNEWHRDKQKEPSIEPPVGVDITNQTAYWKDSSAHIFNYWLSSINTAKSLKMIAAENEIRLSDQT